MSSHASGVLPPPPTRAHFTTAPRESTRCVLWLSSSSVGQSFTSGRTNAAMSSVVVKRPTTTSPDYGVPNAGSYTCKNDLPTGSAASIKMAVDETKKRAELAHMINEETLQERIAEALRERDEQWKRHEKAQINFLQNEGSNMLKGLHNEINRLSNKLRDAHRLLDVGESEEESLAKEQLREQKKYIKELEQQLHEKEAKMAEIEGKVTKTVERMSEQISVQADRIRQLNNELQDRTLTVAQLSGQLRSYRLREAMAVAQQRRRVSSGTINGAVPLASPSSPHRTFPPAGYFGPSPDSFPDRRNLMCRSTPESALTNNIDEKPKSRRRSTSSSFAQPKSPIDIQ